MNHNPDKLELKRKNITIRELRRKLRTIMSIAGEVTQNTSSMETLEAIDSIVSECKKALAFRTERVWRIDR